MNAFVIFAVQNTIAAMVLGCVVYAIKRVARNPPVAHVLWVLVLIKLVAPPLLPVDWPARWRPERLSAGSTSIATILAGDVRPAASDEPSRDDPAAANLTPSPASDVREQSTPASMASIWAVMQHVLLSVWLGGALLCAVVIAARIIPFERLLRDTLPASARLQQLAREIAGRLGVRRIPDVRYVESVSVPLLWRPGRRATILLPASLVRQLDERQVAMILAHELAHVRRGDHWVRHVELVVTAIYWWNPLVWAVRRQIHQEEDLCCDAWVRWAFPEATKLYAEAVLKTAASLAAPQARARLLPASRFLTSLSLKARIEMILKSQFAPRASRKSVFAIAAVALFVLPLCVQAGKTEAAPGNQDAKTTDAAFNPDLRKLRSKVSLAKANFELAKEELQHADQMLRKGYITAAQRDASAYAVEKATLDLRLAEAAVTAFANQPEKAATEKPNPPTKSEFPYAVKFEQGATRFDKDDQITIQEIRGTAETFTPGNIYWIKGTYKLASREKAILLASVTVTVSEPHLLLNDLTVRSDHIDRFRPNGRDPGHATGVELKVQRRNIEEGTGEFTLFLPMLNNGMPHVSFYSVENGQSAGGIYFGTGDTVLRKWWDTKEAESK